MDIFKIKKNVVIILFFLFLFNIELEAVKIKFIVKPLSLPDEKKNKYSRKSYASWELAAWLSGI